MKTRLSNLGLAFALMLWVKIQAVADTPKRYLGDGEIADLAIEIQDDQATLYLAHKPSNQPFKDAKVLFQPENEGDPIAFTPMLTAGLDRATLKNSALPQGDIILEAGDETDAITLSEAPNGKIESKKLVAVAKTVSVSGPLDPKALTIGVALGALMASTFFGLAKLVRSKKNATTALLILSSPLVFLKESRVSAHDGHSHGGESSPLETTDLGSDVTIPKKSQFLVGVTSILATKELLPEAMVAYGHIIAKPQLDATIIAPQAGIIRTTPGSILGKKVALGESLATLDAVNQIQIISPLSGVIQETKAINGTRVESGTKLFHITDTSTVWVDAELFAADLAKLPEVNTAFVTVEGNPLGFNAKLLNIVTPISEETRTAKVYLELNNADGALRLGSLAKINFALKKEIPTIAVPVAAILNRGGEWIVFVQKGPESFSPRQVRTESSSRPGTVLITQGVNEGERIVVTGNYQLLLKVK